MSLLTFSSASAAPADSIVAVVGEKVVLAGEVRQVVEFARLAQPDSLVSEDSLWKTVLAGVVANLVLEDQAGRESIEVSASEVAPEVEENIAALKARFGSEEQYRAGLAAEGLTERALKERYEDEARRKLLARKLMEKEGLTRVYVSPAAAERFYNENRDSIARVPGRVKLAHILLAITPSPTEDSAGQRRMTEVLDVLARGGDFATVASSFSDDRKTAAAGGDPGWVKLAALNPEQMIVLSQLKTGQVSPPFLSRDGYLLVKLEGRSGDNVRFRQILVRVPVTAADSARAKGLAQSLKKKLAAGASFDSLATKYSQDPTTSDSGGRLGEYLISGLSAPFNKVVAAMDSGAVSDPVLSDHGYHLIKALAKQPEKTLTFLEMQDNIRNYLSQQEMERRMKEYVERISDKVFVKRFELAAQPGR